MILIYLLFIFEKIACSADGHDMRTIDKVYPNDPIKDIHREDLDIVEEGEELEDEIDIRY
jgi:hypothetical protein